MESPPVSVDTIWKDDLLDRRSDARRIIDFVTGRVAERIAIGKTGSYVLNIDAAWGQGKTFFLDRLSRQLELEGYVAVNVNAWRDDHADDPLLAIIAAIDDRLEPGTTPEALRSLWTGAKKAGLQILTTAAKGAAKVVAKKLIGDAVDQIASQLDTATRQDTTDVTTDTSDALLDNIADQLLDQFNKDKQSIDAFRAKLAKLAGTLPKHRPLFVIVDELDRCRPPYALAVLERIKHLFTVSGVTFILATDTEQLQHSIRAVYGTGFDAPRYLLRFFDRSIAFREPSYLEFIQHNLRAEPLSIEALSSAPDISCEQLLHSMLTAAGQTPRDMEQSLDILRSAVTFWMASGQLAKLELLWLVPLIIAFQSRQADQFSALAFGKIEVLAQLFKAPTIQASFTQRDPNNSFSNKQVELSLVELANRLMGASKRTFQDFSGPAQSRNVADIWVSTRLLEESKIRYPQGIQVGGQTYSLLRTYPDLVRGAAQFTKLDA